MESGPYQEMKSKGQTSRFTAVLIALVTVILCLLLGLGTWALVSSSNQTPVPIEEAKNIVEEVIIVEEIEPSAKIVQMPPIVADQETTKEILDEAILEEVQEAIKQEESSETENQFYDPEEMPFLHTIVRFSNDIANQVLTQLSENERFASLFNPSSETHSRQRRSISAIGVEALKYLNYLNFGRFMFREVSDITEYAVEGRKLSGDADSMFLDNGFWPSYDEKTTNQVVEKIDTDVTSVDSDNESTKLSRPPSAFDGGWTPMVNKVNLKFITQMLTTLLNLMREYLMRDNVMECLWYMFCKDINHQAKYTDPMGYLSRVNR